MRAGRRGLRVSEIDYVNSSSSVPSSSTATCGAGRRHSRLIPPRPSSLTPITAAATNRCPSAMKAKEALKNTTTHCVVPDVVGRAADCGPTRRPTAPCGGTTRIGGAVTAASGRDGKAALEPRLNGQPDEEELRHDRQGVVDEADGGGSTPARPLDVPQPVLLMRPSESPPAVGPPPSRPRAWRVLWKRRTPYSTVVSLPPLETTTK